MIHTDEDAVICDLAETYGILNFRMLPIELLATLCNGLRDDSRIIQKISGSKLSKRDELLALMTDRLSWLCWSKTEDAQKGKNVPQSLYNQLQGIEEQDPSKHKYNDVVVFDSVDELELALKRAKEGDTQWQKEAHQ